MKTKGKEKMTTTEEKPNRTHKIETGGGGTIFTREQLSIHASLYRIKYLIFYYNNSVKDKKYKYYLMYIEKRYSSVIKKYH